MPRGHPLESGRISEAARLRQRPSWAPHRPEPSRAAHTTRVRDVDGVLWHAPNGEIRRVGNKSQGWSRALLDIKMAYSNDLPTAMRVIKQTAFEREGIELPVTAQAVVLNRPPNSVRQVQTGRARPGRLCAWPSRRSSRWSSPAARASGWPR